MSEMIERVARVLCAAEYGDGDAKYFDAPLWRNYVDTARAVIEAMRNPTPEMDEAGSGFVQSEFAWEAMIDAALKDD